MTFPASAHLCNPWQMMPVAEIPEMHVLLTCIKPLDVAEANAHGTGIVFKHLVQLNSVRFHRVLVLFNATNQNLKNCHQHVNDSAFGITES